jgi:hypothetical protein
MRTQDEVRERVNLGVVAGRCALSAVDAGRAPLAAGSGAPASAPCERMRVRAGDVLETAYELERRNACGHDHGV